ncbi:hypothetical protein ACFTAO_36180 [Paenibacillus rhizoplanae]
MSDKPLLQKQSVAWTGILSDVLLAVAKGSIGYLSGSKALLGGCNLFRSRCRCQTGGGDSVEPEAE